MNLGEYFRGRRDKLLREVISRTNREGPYSILDVGGRVDYWNRLGIDFLRRNNVHVTLLNLTESEIGQANQELFSLCVGDATALQFGDESFDLVHSNSVIEHVGDWAKMKAFASETIRVGRNYYVQTPYFWCPVDPHYSSLPMIHWLPRTLQLRAFEALPLAFSGKADGIDEAHDILASATLLDRRQFRYLFPEADHRFEKVLGVPKSMIAIHEPPIPGTAKVSGD